MNGGSGTFTARIPGNYFFTFSGQTGNVGNLSNNDDNCVWVYKNSEHKLLIYEGNNLKDENNLSYSWIFRLQSNDKIHLTTCTKTALFGNSGEWITFTGHLLLADD